MSPKKNGAGGGAPNPKTQTANCAPALYHAATLAEAGQALLAVSEAGEIEELREHLALERWHWRRERNERPVGLSPWLVLLTGDLARFTGAPRKDCEAALRENIEPQWPNVACGEIVAFAAALAAQRRGAA